MNLNNNYSWIESRSCAHDYISPIVKSILSRLKIVHSATILDARCGGGYVVHVRHTIDYPNTWGFDISNSGIEVSRTSFPEIKGKFKIHDAHAKELPHSFSISEFRFDSFD